MKKKVSRYTPSNWVANKENLYVRDLDLQVGIGLHWVWSE